MVEFQYSRTPRPGRAQRRFAHPCENILRLNNIFIDNLLTIMHLNSFLTARIPGVDIDTNTPNTQREAITFSATGSEYFRI